MTDLPTLIALRDKVAGLTGPDREVDRLLWLALPDEHSDVLRPEQRPSLTGSLDEVDALRERVLPGFAAAWGNMAFKPAPSGLPWATIWNPQGSIIANAAAPTAPLAYLLAVLNALVAKETP